jgi:hypothetical protein
LPERPSSGVADEQGAFYFTSNDLLIKAQLSTGSAMWHTNLAKVPEQTYSPPQKLTERVKAKVDQLTGGGQLPVLQFPGHRFGNPNRYSFSRPVIAGDKLLLSREAFSGGGCIIDFCYADWLMVDQWNGALVDGAPGKLAGGHSNDFLTTGAHAFRIQNGIKKQLENPLPNLKNRMPFMMHSEGERLSYRGVTLFCPTHGDQPLEVPVIGMDGKTLFQLTPTKSIRQSGWAVLEKGYLHYSEKSDYWFPNKKTPDLWLEYFDDKGKRVQTKALSTQLPDHVGFLGWTKKGRAVLNNGDELYVVNVPELTVATSLPRLPATPERFNYNGPRFYCGRNADVVFRLEGGCSFEELPPKGEKCEIALSAYRSETLKPLWQAKESVLLKKKP